MAFEIVYLYIHLGEIEIHSIKKYRNNSSNVCMDETRERLFQALGAPSHGVPDPFNHTLNVTYTLILDLTPKYVVE